MRSLADERSLAMSDPNDLFSSSQDDGWAADCRGDYPPSRGAVVFMAIVLFLAIVILARCLPPGW